MAKTISIKKGLNIPLSGVADSRISADKTTDIFAIVPDDFPGYTWKIAVKPGDSVKAGDTLLFAKECEDVRLSSPVCGTVEEVKRGERRKIEYVSVKRTEENSFSLPEASASLLTRLQHTGLFAMLRQRPFDIVPDAQVRPRDIFVTAFDTAPLAPAMLNENNVAFLEAGLKALASLTDGKVYLSVPEDSAISSAHAEVVKFSGPHPAGNVGTQIAAIRPVNKGEIVWTLDAVTVARIGRFVEKNELDFSACVALTGPDIKDPHFIQTIIGAKLSTLLAGQIKESDKKVRVISGNVLTGKRVSVEEGFLRYPYRQITAIDEGDKADEFMGWASMNPKKYSVKRTFPAFLRGLSKPFNFDARIKGGHRAMILSGEYDKVFPFDIYPEYLIKAILAKNIEKMEQRGIYEVAPEDFALPEFVDTSKLELQKIVREGLDYLRKETM